ncbi:hypothetical protein [Helicobacter felistomachi]|nr:hypothetical protein [Helicobacter sp. NHP21005]
MMACLVTLAHMNAHDTPPKPNNRENRPFAKPTNNLSHFKALLKPP